MWVLGLEPGFSGKSNLSHPSLLFSPVFVFRLRKLGFEDDTVKSFSYYEGNVWDFTLEENQILWSHQLGKDEREHLPPNAQGMTNRRNILLLLPEDPLAGRLGPWVTHNCFQEFRTFQSRSVCSFFRA